MAPCQISPQSEVYSHSTQLTILAVDDMEGHPSSEVGTLQLLQALDKVVGGSIAEARKYGDVILTCSAMCEF